VSITIFDFIVCFTYKANEHRPRNHGALWLHRLRPREFCQAFRMTKQAFFRLLRLVKEDLTKYAVKAIASSGSSVTPIIKLAATIRWLVRLFVVTLLFFRPHTFIVTQAGGMYIDICGLFGLSQTSFFHPVHDPLWPTLLHAIDIALADYVQFQTDVISCEKAASAFAHFSRGMLSNCVCAVYGNLTPLQNSLIFLSYLPLIAAPVLVLIYIYLL
jgi:hypothetical protein